MMSHGRLSKRIILKHLGTRPRYHDRRQKMCESSNILERRSSSEEDEIFSSGIRESKNEGMFSFKVSWHGYKGAFGFNYDSCNRQSENRIYYIDLAKRLCMIQNYSLK